MDGAVHDLDSGGEGRSSFVFETPDTPSIVPLIVFDTETAGTSPDHVIQIAYLRADGARLTAKSFYFDADAIDPHAEKVHGIGVDRLHLLSAGRRFADIASEMHEDFASARFLCAHNARFDVSKLKSEFSRTNRTLDDKNSFCSMRYFTRFVGKRNARGVVKQPSLSELTRTFGIGEKDAQKAAKTWFTGVRGAHDACFDAATLYLCLVEASRRRQLGGLFNVR